MERDLRLRREWEVRRARNRGRSFADGPLVARVLANGTEPPVNRYAVVAGKKVGDAVRRNRLKRLVREALRHLHPTLRPGYDVVIVVRGTVEEMPGYAAARASLDRIVRRAGLLGLDAGGEGSRPAASVAPDRDGASRPAGPARRAPTRPATDPD